MQEKSRIVEVDMVRGIAIVLMVIYHLLFDLRYFGIMNIDIFSLPMIFFQRTVAFLFLTIAGVSIVLSEKKHGSYEAHAKHALVLGAAALLITIVTWIYPHNGFITFGIIHFLALSALIAPLFVKLDAKILVALGVIALIAGTWMVGLTVSEGYLFWLGLASSNYSALDYYPLLPWFGLVLFGMVIGKTIYARGKSLLVNQKEQSRIVEALVLLGKNSLAIYLVHQVILVGIVLFYRILVFP